MADDFGVSTPADLLQESVKTFRQRAEVYGDNYKTYGTVIKALFPNGVYHGDRDCSIDFHNRFGILVQIVSKLTRYCENFNKGGHDDSLNDLSVYCAMLRHLDLELAKSDEVPF